MNPELGIYEAHGQAQCPQLAHGQCVMHTEGLQGSSSCTASGEAGWVSLNQSAPILAKKARGKAEQPQRAARKERWAVPGGTSPLPPTSTFPTLGVVLV